MDAPRIAIVLSDRNGREDTLMCLSSLTALNDVDVRVIDKAPITSASN
jgi:hypothetical protein